MSYIIDFFKSLGEIISSIVDFIIDFFEGLVSFFMDLPDYISTLETYIDIVPDEIKVMLLLVLSVSLIFVIIGRRGV